MSGKQTTILVADDDPQLLDLIRTDLQLEGYEVLQAHDGQQALDQIQAYGPDLVLLDVMMPKVDGFAVCQRIRAFSAVPIIILTVLGNDEEKVRGLDLGADDYLTKPFSMEELLARVRAVLRRSRFSAHEHLHGFLPTTRNGDLTVDYVQYQVTRAGQPISLTPIEFRMLSYLVQNAGRVVTRNLLLEQVWGPEYVDESHLLQVNMNRLRHKLELDPAHPRYILTKPGIGYVIAAQPDGQAVVAEEHTLQVFAG